TDANGDGTIDSLDLGFYKFSSLTPGSYDVIESYTQRPPGWTLTFPAGNLWGPLTISSATPNYTGISFGNMESTPQFGTIAGTKYNDITGNGFSADDSGLGGTTINLYQGTNSSGTLLASTTTAANGSYSFDNLAPGTYFVQESLTSDYVQTGGNAGYVV